VRLTLAFWNAWLLCVPMVLSGGVSTCLRRDLARRLSDMTGYTPRERMFTVIASMLPYPFMVLAVFTPFAPPGLLFAAGLLVATLGNAGFAMTLFVFARGSSDQPLRTGPYRISRNPLYVSAALVFLGVCVSAGSLLLAAILAVLLAFQHAMILAEERACTRKYGEPYIAYARNVPRYLGWL
jgi:protein-S-isoprenylcysteine O-methyltransferase Ste14